MNTGKFFLLTALLQLFVLGSFGQTKDFVIKNSRRLYSGINHDSTLKKIKVDEDEFSEESSDGGGDVTAWYKKDTIRKVVIEIGLSWGLTREEYYFDKGQVFFIYETEKSFPVSSDKHSLDPTKLDLNFEGRYYFDRQKLIDIKLKGQRRFGEKTSTATVNAMITGLGPYLKILRSHIERAP